MKLYLSQYYRSSIAFSIICMLVLMNPLKNIAAELTIPHNSRVDAIISNGVIDVIIKEQYTYFKKIDTSSTLEGFAIITV